MDATPTKGSHGAKSTCIAARGDYNGTAGLHIRVSELTTAYDYNVDTIWCAASVQSMLDALAPSALFENQPANTAPRGYSPTVYSFLANNSTLSEANVALASAWESSCYDHHSSCAAATQDSTLPTRVINVLNLGGAILEDGGCRRDKYLTLSYKWGGTKRYLTLTDNIACHYDTISHEELPKTFQDAIYVTQQLGFKYLWIVGLCIVHDRHEDLQREISHMGDIYRGASLTLLQKLETVRNMASPLNEILGL
jgi:hypothetical protein